MIYALDTNMIIHLLNGNPAVRIGRDNAINRGDKIIIPPLVNFEMLRGFLCKSAVAKERAYKSLCAVFEIEEMNEQIWQRGAVIYADLYKRRLTGEDADILIAAFCIENNYVLVTNNTKHFSIIDSLKLEDWTK